MVNIKRTERHKHDGAEWTKLSLHCWDVLTASRLKDLDLDSTTCIISVSVGLWSLTSWSSRCVCVCVSWHHHICNILTAAPGAPALESLSSVCLSWTDSGAVLVCSCHMELCLVSGQSLYPEQSFIGPVYCCLSGRWSPGPESPAPPRLLVKTTLNHRVWLFQEAAVLSKPLSLSTVCLSIKTASFCLENVGKKIVWFTM